MEADGKTRTPESRSSVGRCVGLQRDEVLCRVKGLLLQGLGLRRPAQDSLRGFLLWEPSRRVCFYPIMVADGRVWVLQEVVMKGLP